MATYKKRGYKPKTKKEKEDVVEEASTTAEVFNTLDESASKAEQWVVKNQNYIFGLVGTVAVIILGIMGYNRFIAEPKATEAMNEMTKAQSYFEDALTATESDSLYRLSLNGGEGKFGMLDIISEYGSTPAGNLANYYAGLAYLNLKDYQNAITYLDAFSSDDIMLSAIAKGSIGDAFAQLEQYKDALDHYEKAITTSTNDFTTPLYLLKAAQVAVSLGENDKALTYLNRIKAEYPNSNEFKDIDVIIGRASASL